MSILNTIRVATSHTGLADGDETAAPATNPDPLREPSRVGKIIPVKESKASVAKRWEGPEGAVDAESLRDSSQDIVRNASRAFRDACESSDEDEREANYLVARSMLDNLWGFAKHRDAPFRDLLAMLTAATKYTTLESFNETQRDALRTAFQDLNRWLLDDSTVMGHIESFAEHDIDITGPIRSVPTKKFRVIIEEVD